MHFGLADRVSTPAPRQLSSNTFGSTTFVCSRSRAFEGVSQMPRRKTQGIKNRTFVPRTNFRRWNSDSVLCFEGKTIRIRNRADPNGDSPTTRPPGADMPRPNRQSDSIWQNQSYLRYHCSSSRIDGSVFLCCTGVVLLVVHKYSADDACWRGSSPCATGRIV